jgi:AcrR family transcriptional regulator
VLYRRWPNRAALVLATMRRHVGARPNHVPDTGALRSDVLAMLRQASLHFDQLGEVGPDIVRGLTSELRDLPRTHAFQVMPAAMMTILERAAVRGEVCLERVTPRIAALPGDLVRHEILTTHAAVPDAVLTEIVDDIFLPLVYAPNCQPIG